MNKPNEYITDMFHKLREDISGIKHKLFAEKPKQESVIEAHPHYAINAAHENGQSREEDDKAIRATLYLPQSIHVDAKTEERQKEWYKDRTIWLQGITIAIGVIVGVIYFFQLRAMQTSVEIDQRAWIKPTLIEQGHVITPGGTQPNIAWWNFKYTNTGKTPALKVHMIFQLDIVPPDQTPDFSFDPPRGDEGNEAIMFPQIDYDGTAGLQYRNDKGKIAPVEITPELTRKFINQEVLFMIHGEITYQDIFRRPHFIRTCNWMRSSVNTTSKFTVASKACDVYTTIDMEQ